MSAPLRLAGLKALVLAVGLALCGAGLAQTSPAATTTASISRMGPGDQIRIQVYQNADLSQEAKIAENGMVTMPLLGQLQLGGLTTFEAESRISAMLQAAGLLRNPQISVSVVNNRANTINVLGNFGKPGKLPLDVMGMRLTDVLALVGGVDSEAGDQLVLMGTRQGQSIRRQIDIQRLFEPGGESLNEAIHPGDVLWVGKAPQVYIYGEILRPGAFRLTRGMTLMQAIAASGGVSPRGTLRGLKLTRTQPEGGTRELEPRMEDTLRDGDVIYVRESLF
ncbi:polysaccharide export protein EpsE [Ideonella livida]|uniref:Polysaccharide export protein EpsE n=1 Tax=Ideonella livida TaxID=2707176 RepID=A0A7C9PGL5_9BURK|nr:polysaccharide export protein EpsE [Ideonella livida]NDY90912.1 polysaccharide export protein EpsE [Ideonella livida]